MRLAERDTSRSAMPRTTLYFIGDAALQAAFR
jgi:hypothetical protein